VRDNKVIELYARVRCLLRKDGTLIGLKTLIKKIDNTGTVKRLPGGLVGARNGPTFTSVANHT